MNILAIGSHPDDLEYGCGGTLLKLSARGNKVSLFVLSAGEIGGDPKARIKEQQRSAKILKAKLYLGDFKDTEIVLSKKLINSIENVIRKVNPTLIFVHHLEDTHQDHRNVSQATITATRYIRNVLFYEVPTTVNFSPTVFVDIGKIKGKKLKLLESHKSQVHLTRVAELSILESAGSSSIFRGFQNRVKHAEGFVPLRLALDFNL
ncbi:MAG: hypothetical protein AUJ85_06515 [Elusimicrobia bacterium CG1_02_37_114]|nr:MAG: hypothetical protein AUJ85_06515 [Elusimicrobia bacterium CG1_02_37_114]